MFEYAHLEKHTESTLEYDRFGILKLKTIKMPMTTLPLYIHFTLDYSGSMIEMATHHATKLELVMHTINNVIHYLHESVGSFHTVEFQIDRFNKEYETIYPRSRIPKDDEELADFETTFMKKNFPRADTNIELALKESRKTIETYSETHPETRVLHLFLTDGEATRGKTKTTDLVKIIETTRYPTIYIGYGEDHHAKLLNELANHSGIGSSYEYIHNFEKTTSVYGEILHRYLYPAIDSISFVCKECFIFNNIKNIWYGELFDGTIAGEQERVYSLLLNSDNASIDIYDKERLLETVHIRSNGNLTIYIFKQKTIELLSSAVTLNYNHKTEIKIMKTKLNDLYKQIHEYMKTISDEKETLFLEVLCDDLYISYSTLGSSLGEMLTISRCSTQARQMSYRVDIEIDEYTFPCDDDNDAETQDLDKYKDSIETHTYDSTRELLYSPQVRNTIRNIDNATPTPKII